MYFFQYFYFLCRFLIRLLIRLPKIKRDAILFLQTEEKKWGGKIHSPSFQAIVRFHSFGQLFVSDHFLKCMGRYSDAKETEQHLLYYTLMHLDDHLIDDGLITLDRLDQLFYKPDSSLGNTVDERVLLDAHIRLLAIVKNRDAYFKDLEQIHIAQKKSQTQISASLSFEELVKMDQDKGGSTFLMLHHFMDLPDSAVMAPCLYQLGGVIQMMNDLMDVHKDLQNGVATFANAATRYQQAEEVYMQQVNALQDAIRSLPFASIQKQWLSILFSLVSAMGFVAIDNLKKIQGESDQLPDLRSVPRKALIVDMERLGHIYLLAKHSYRLGKLNRPIA